MIQEQFKAFLESVATPENQTVIEAMVIGIKVIHESEGNAPFADLNGDVELTKEGAELIVDFKYTGNISEIPGIYENLQKSGYVDELTEAGIQLDPSQLHSLWIAASVPYDASFSGGYNNASFDDPGHGPDADSSFGDIQYDDNSLELNVNGKNVSLGIDFTDPAMKAFFDPIVINAIKASGLSEKANDMLEENYRNDYDDDQYLRKSGMGARMAAHDL